ncbi:hypothetical protein [Rhizobium sp. OK494]|uniref:hypothetical protein n=1 Tax=Rhizobium sp. 11_C7_N12_5 TaxID=3240770 RepID=UPI0012E0607E
MVLDHYRYALLEPVKECQQCFPMELMFARHQSGVQDVFVHNHTQGGIPPHVTPEFVKSTDNIEPGIFPDPCGAPMTTGSRPIREGTGYQALDEQESFFSYVEYSRTKAIIVKLAAKVVVARYEIKGEPASRPIYKAIVD